MISGGAALNKCYDRAHILRTSGGADSTLKEIACRIYKESAIEIKAQWTTEAVSPRSGGFYG